MANKRFIAITLCFCLMGSLCPSIVYAINKSNPNLEYVRMSVELKEQIEKKLYEGSASEDGTLTVEIESKIAPDKKQIMGIEANNVAADEFATDANNSRINLFLAQSIDYHIYGTSGEFKGNMKDGILYLTQLTSSVVVLEPVDVLIARDKVVQVAEQIRNETTSKNEMVRLTNKYITENTEYILDHNTETQPWLWSITGPLLRGEAVCMGYAYAFKRILDELDIPTETIFGVSETGEDHAWSRSRVDGTWYYSDVTYNDPVGGLPTEDFLMLTKSDFYNITKHKPTYDPEEHMADNAFHTMYREYQEYEAQELKAKGLFLGDERGFRLEEGLTRVEMAALLTRVVGGTELVEFYSDYYSQKCEFTDVPYWGRKYVGYCFEKGLVKGIGNGLYGSNNQANKLDFCTVMLRATGITQGYEYNTSDQKAVELGYINEGRTAFADLNRADVVHVIYNIDVLGQINNI